MGKFSFGSDPEMVVVDKKGNLKSAIGIVPGKKLERYDLGGGHKAYYDNVLAECEIKPSYSPEEAVANFGDCIKRCANLIKPYRLVIQASATFPKKECEHPDALVFGCDAEYDAYDVQICQPPSLKEGNTFRSAGGHIHIGFDGGKDFENVSMSEDEYQEACNKIAWNRIWTIRMCDCFIGLSSILMDHDPTSAARRKLYGGAGTHRPCNAYGVEYRCLSNFWLSKPDLVYFIYQLSEFVVSLVEKKQHEDIWNKIDPKQLQKTINSGDPKKAKPFFEQLKGYMPDKFIQKIHEFELNNKNNDFYKNWKITI